MMRSSYCDLALLEEAQTVIGTLLLPVLLCLETNLKLSESFRTISLIIVNAMMKIAGQIVLCQHQASGAEMFMIFTFVCIINLLRI